MDRVRANVCLTISEGAKLQCYPTRNGEICVAIGDTDHELTFDRTSFTDFVEQGALVLAELAVELVEAQTAEGAMEARL